MIQVAKSRVVLRGLKSDVSFEVHRQRLVFLILLVPKLSSRIAAASRAIGRPHATRPTRRENNATPR